MALLAALASGSPADAAEVPNHVPKGQLASGFKTPCGVAPATTGEVFISNYYANEVFALRPSPPGPGPLISGVTSNNGPCALAIDLANNLYVNAFHGPVVRYAAPSYQVATVVDPGPATGIAIDRPTGDLYVNDRDSVAVYKAPVKAEQVALRIGEGSLLDAYGVGVSAFAATDNLVYVADAGDDTVKVYDQNNPTVPLQTIDGAGTASGHFISLTDSTVTVDSSNGHFYVVDNSQPGFYSPAALVQEFNGEGLYRGLLTTVTHSEPVGVAIWELAGPRRGEVFVTSGNDDVGFGSVNLFGAAGAGQILTVTKSGPGSGTVTSGPAGIACGSACKAEFNSGATVALTATPAPGSAFAGWSGACGGSGSCQVTLAAAASVNAEFVAAPALSALSLAVPTPAIESADASGLELGRARPLRAGAVALAVSAPAAGVLTVSGGLMRTAKARFSAAGTRTLRLRLDRPGRRTLARAKAGRLTFRAEFGFVSGDGAATHARELVTFTLKSREKR